MLPSIHPRAAGRRAAAAAAGWRRSSRSSAAGLAAAPATAPAAPSGDWRGLRLRSCLVVARALQKLVFSVLLVRHILVVDLRPALPEPGGYQPGLRRLLLGLGLRRHRLQHSDDIVTCAMCTNQQCAGLGVAARGRSGPPLAPSPRPSYWAGVRTSWAPTSRSAHAHKVVCGYLPTILSLQRGEDRVRPKIYPLRECSDAGSALRLMRPTPHEWHGRDTCARHCPTGGRILAQTAVRCAARCAAALVGALQHRAECY